MQNEIEHELAMLGGRSACTVVRLDEAAPRDLVSIHPDMLFPAASLIKVPILIEVARQVEFGILSWNMHCTVPSSACVSGSGVLADLSQDLRPTLQDLASLMITISDNTASNILLDLIGMESVNTTMQHLGLTSTRLERHFMDVEARRAGRDNWTTAGDMALLLSLFCTDLLPGRDQMLKMLLRQNDNSILSAYWGEETPFAHKTGELQGILHDAGILYPPYRTQTSQSPLIVVAMTADQADVALTRYVLARIGRIIHKTPSL